MKIAFIDLSYHKKTKSSTFFIDIITPHNNIEFFYWDGKKKEDIRQTVENINDSNCDCVIFWQIIPSYKLLSLLISDNIIFVPMYDACHNWKYFQWYKYGKLRFISFSKTLHDKLSEMGIVSFYIRYMSPLPENFDPKNIRKNNQSVFLWNRNGSIQINQVISFISYNQWNRFVIHEAPDQQIVDNKKNREMNVEALQVEKTAWFNSQLEYIQTISSCDVYISPREYEGIGLSFLEAMRMGLCVVAKNNPTMNEYIEHGINGFLFNTYKELTNLKIQNLISIKENAFKTSSDAYEEYKKRIPLLQQFIFHDFEKNTIQRYTIKFLIKDMHSLIKQYYKSIVRRILTVFK
jgi:glycosyltransferase involved in cell wall biosynthesis